MTEEPSAGTSRDPSAGTSRDPSAGMIGEGSVTGEPRADAPRSLELYGRALRDHFAGDLEATLRLYSSLGERDDLPVGLFFREPEAFFPFERAALDLVRGRALDAGAGTGVHALPLQRRGIEVTALELVPEAVEIMKARGVERVLRGDMFELRPGRFDTVLMLMNGIGPVGTLDGLDRFLQRAGRLLRSGGQILVDSGEALPEIEEASERDPRMPAADEAAYPGEARIRLEYRGELGAPFRELYVDALTFARRAHAAGWRFELAFEDESQGYLARLTRETA